MSSIFRMMFACKRGYSLSIPDSLSKDIDICIDTLGSLMMQLESRKEHESRDSVAEFIGTLCHNSIDSCIGLTSSSSSSSLHSIPSSIEECLPSVRHFFERCDLNLCQQTRIISQSLKHINFLPFHQSSIHTFSSSINTIISELSHCSIYSGHKAWPVGLDSICNTLGNFLKSSITIPSKLSFPAAMAPDEVLGGEEEDDDFEGMGVSWFGEEFLEFNRIVASSPSSVLLTFLYTKMLIELFHDMLNCSYYMLSFAAIDCDISIDSFCKHLESVLNASFNFLKIVPTGSKLSIYIDDILGRCLNGFCSLLADVEVRKDVVQKDVCIHRLVVLIESLEPHISIIRQLTQVKRSVLVLISMFVSYDKSPMLASKLSISSLASVSSLCLRGVINSNLSDACVSLVVLRSITRALEERLVSKFGDMDEKEEEEEDMILPHSMRVTLQAREEECDHDWQTSTLREMRESSKAKERVLSDVEADSDGRQILEVFTTIIEGILSCSDTDPLQISLQFIKDLKSRKKVQSHDTDPFSLNSGSSSDFGFSVSTSIQGGRRKGNSAIDTYEQERIEKERMLQRTKLMILLEVLSVCVRRIHNVSGTSRERLDMLLGTKRGQLRHLFEDPIVKRCVLHLSEGYITLTDGTSLNDEEKKNVVAFLPPMFSLCASFSALSSNYAVVLSHYALESVAFIVEKIRKLAKVSDSSIMIEFLDRGARGVWEDKDRRQLRRKREMESAATDFWAGSGVVSSSSSLSALSCGCITLLSNSLTPFCAIRNSIMRSSCRSNDIDAAVLCCVVYSMVKLLIDSSSEETEDDSTPGVDCIGEGGIGKLRKQMKRCVLIGCHGLLRITSKAGYSLKETEAARTGVTLESLKQAHADLKAFEGEGWCDEARRIIDLITK
ncbi:hypothetical protein ADUPG1_010622 [Aduncisulcus paluster]|uniref:Uncharacterized protein n=1 Tax=Aduncisulcus paluster TaxID=2918883 RepID=A0ABQ5JWN4_9EUKA|nr:hypothetical protein ADUPG1_010622 [Aduncisulcus paluster]